MEKIGGAPSEALKRFRVHFFGVSSGAGVGVIMYFLFLSLLQRVTELVTYIKFWRYSTVPNFFNRVLHNVDPHDSCKVLPAHDTCFNLRKQGGH